MDPPKPPERRGASSRIVYKDPIPGRLELLRAKMEKHETPAVLISSSENRRYFSGFKAEDSMITESSGFLLITLKSHFLVTDSRYTTAALREAPFYEVVTYPYSPVQTVKELLAGEKDIFFEPDYVTVTFFQELCAYLGNEGPKPLPFSLGEFRIVKSEDELALIRKAVQITEKALGALWKEIEPGIPEIWASKFLEAKFKDLGAEGPAFPSIIAAGPNGALPHAVPGKKKLGKKEMMIIDIGARYRGYASDMTRTWANSNPEGWQREIYRIVREAQLKALDTIKAGVTGEKVDRAAREHIKKAGYGKFFKHSLGHGVGLLVHEEPRLSPRAVTPLLAGSLVTVEPGIYIPGKGGVRLEELVLVREDGATILNKDLHFYDFS
jgi:Xaa-Pro aminopeptidase